ncbi:MAG: imidazolonepropionase [Arenimonas sp.]|nr:imidazolonepropionase [Arenimonas sp.]
MNQFMREKNGLLLNAHLATLNNQEQAYGAIENGAMAWRNGQIIFIGKQAELPQAIIDEFPKAIDAQGAWVTPALIDCHTHLVFAGNRAPEFEQRLQGINYQDIAKAGGGILSTVRQTRAASEEELFSQSLPRLQALIQDGVTCVEIKSGYGLDLATERKMLRVARQLATHCGVTVKTTYLAAHALPPEYTNQADAYIEQVCHWMAILHEEQLIDAVDAFCEGIGFSPEQTRRVFTTARGLGLPVKCHADQLSDLAGAGLSAEFSGLSADHVEFTSEASIQKMAAHGTVAVLLPGAFHVLRETKLPPVALFERYNIPMAVATDCNPGTAPLLSLRLAMAMACSHFRLTPEQALRGATVHAAAALGIRDRGQLKIGYSADCVLWRVKHPSELCYWFAGDFVQCIIRA